tara:strand:- start:189 stop:647 length:459 start_codon:yes stop_codon:yes gene_type:complete
MEVILPDDPKNSTPPKKKGVLNKLKEGLDDKEEQLAILSTFVRLGVVIWSGFIISLNYIEIPGLGQQTPKDITFVASIFTGCLASFGIETAKKRGDGTYKSDGEKPLSKADIEKIVATQSGGFQTIRVETPIKILGAEVVEPPVKPSTNPPA